MSSSDGTARGDTTLKCQARCASTWVATLIPGLPDDVVRQILVQLPRSKWFNLWTVCKSWRLTVEDPWFYQSRIDLKLAEEWCYTEAWHPQTKLVSWFAFDFTEGTWTGLPQVPQKRGLDWEIFGRASTSFRGELYVVGGKAGVSGPTLGEMYTYSPLTHQWRQGKSMITTRHSPLMFSYYQCKIYVLGGFDFLNNTIVTGECYDVDADEWTLVGNVGYPEVLCPSWYEIGWQAQWIRLHFSGDEHFVSYKTKDSQQCLKYYILGEGTWVFKVLRDKAKALMRYSVGGIVDKTIVLLDWANGRFRYTHYASRNVDWATVPGMADLDWVTILRYNPKVSAVGSKLVLVGRRLSIWTIETNQTLLKATDRNFITSIPALPVMPDLQPLTCVTIVA